MMVLLQLVCFDPCSCGGFQVWKDSWARASLARPMADAAFFGLSSTTKHLLQSILKFEPDDSWSTAASRDLDAFEIFCGRAHLSEALKKVSWLCSCMAFAFVSYV